MEPLVDTHCHLTLGALAGNFAEVWERARAAGVVQAVIVGVDASSSREVVAAAATQEGLFATVGIHPNSCRQASPRDHAVLRELVTQPNVVAVGETGIDLYRRRSELGQQQRWLERQAQLALDHDLPLVLHIRNGFAQALQVLEQFRGTPMSGVVHCFSGGPGDLEPFLSGGYFISFSGNVTYKNAGNIQAAAAKVPADRYVVETDAPFLAPVPHRGKTNEIAWVVETAGFLGRVRHIPFSQVAQETTANARQLFRLPDPEGSSSA